MGKGNMKWGGGEGKGREGKGREGKKRLEIDFEGVMKRLAARAFRRPEKQKCRNSQSVLASRVINNSWLRTAYRSVSVEEFLHLGFRVKYIASYQFLLTGWVRQEKKNRQIPRHQHANLASQLQFDCRSLPGTPCSPCGVVQITGRKTLKPGMKDRWKEARKVLSPESQRSHTDRWGGE